MNSIRDSSILCSQIKNQFQNKRNQILTVLIGGLSCSGKSTLCKDICLYLKENKIENRYVCLDNWLIGINQRTGKETVRERFVYDEIVKSILVLINGNDLTTLVYDSASRMKSKNSISIKHLKSGVLIIDGVVSLDIKDLRQLSRFRVYVSTSPEERLKRLVSFHRLHKKLTMEETISIIDRRAVDETPIIEDTKNFANYLFVN